ncbi:MAG: SMP-30/gluconolactonase/LRE family protein [Gammaproteobacteria bacterium]|nr:SMP-30/gluconolactonase/LRE family protein [Gammaproteobacteria bacterium]
MKAPAVVVLALLAIVIVYFVAWPVPIEPVLWDAPADEGLTGDFSPNSVLSGALPIDLGRHEGPEDIALGKDGKLYATTRAGAILQIALRDHSIRVFADAGGRPLGIEVLDDGSLVVANAYTGLQHISTNGTVTNWLTEINGEAIGYADDVAVARDGRIFLTNASQKFAAAAAGDTLDASLVDILEHGGNGSVIEFDPESGKASIIVDGLNFANGIAISDDQKYLLIAETASYRILKHWLAGPNAGSTEIIRDNLPGFPDNINNGLQGRFWIGLVAPRNAIIDKYSGRPWVRKVIYRLPDFLRPQAVPSSHVIAIDGDGTVLMDMQDTSARFPMLTGVLETSGALYLTSLVGHQFGRLDKRDLL